MKIPIFFLKKRQARIGSAAYVTYLSEQLLPAGEELHQDGFILQQGGAPAHRNGVVQDFFREYCTFVTKDKWLTNFPDLSPLNNCGERTLRSREPLPKGEVCDSGGAQGGHQCCAGRRVPGHHVWQYAPVEASPENGRPCKGVLPSCTGPSELAKESVSSLF